MACMRKVIQLDVCPAMLALHEASKTPANKAIPHMVSASHPRSQSDNLRLAREHSTAKPTGLSVVGDQLASFFTRNGATNQLLNVVVFRE